MKWEGSTGGICKLPYANKKFIFMQMKKLSSFISIDPDIRFGKPCIKGTRIAISDILQWLASGMTHTQILEDYPLLTEEHIRAALMFAANRESMIKIIAA
jgi:uncharacterized protein (DUF433 family)